MPGMTPHPLNLSNIAILFRHSLFVTSILWVGALALILLVVVLLTRRIFNFNLSTEGMSEPRSRTYLRWSFGAFWLFDGFLQFQGSMPLGMANNVVAPAAVGTPSWIHSLMLHGVSIWNSHPIALAVGVAWLQIGIGLLLLASNGRTGRIVGAMSAMWATLIWFIGNGAGGIFISGASILFGFPGATFFYAVAGVWLALDYRTFEARFSRYTLRGMAVLLAVAIVFQSLPSANFWHGGNTNALTAMSKYMSAIAQPHWLTWILHRVGSIASAMGGGFNIVVILWLAICAVGLWLAATNAWRWPVWTLVVGAIFFWVVAEDLAIFGGLATDLNSLIPLAALTWCAKARNDAGAVVPRRLPREMTSSAGAVVATFASSMLAFSIVSMSIASIAGAENTLYLAQNGPASQINVKARVFTLTDQFNKPYTLGEHAGRTTLLTFLDPHCWTDCPLLANQLAHLRSQLASNAKLDIVAVAADPYYETLHWVRSFMKKHGLYGVKNFYFVTGPLAKTSAVWRDYGVTVTMKRTDKMSVHSDLMFIVTSKGSLRWVIPDDPIATSSGTASAVAELSSLLALEGIH